MKKMEKIKDWLRSIFVTKYVITRRKVLAWLILRKGQEQKIENVFGQTQLLVSKEKFFLQHYYSKYIGNAKKMNRLQAWIWLKWLQRINEKKYKFEILTENRAVFITDLTGLTEN